MPTRRPACKAVCLAGRSRFGQFRSTFDMIAEYFTGLQAQLQASMASLEARGAGGLSAYCRLSSPAPGAGAAADGSVRAGGGGQEGLLAVVAAAAAAAASGALGAAWAALAAGCWRLLELGGALYLSMRYFTGACRLCRLFRSWPQRWVLYLIRCTPGT